MPWYPYPTIFACGKTYGKSASKPFDVILVSGDAYVDHPSFPGAVLTRVLESLGLSVAVIAQPDWRSQADFLAFGRPSLFFAVTSGAMDSMVSNYTSMGMPRKIDRLSPGGQPGMRPKRAVQVYCQRLREAFKGTPIVIGGIEASLRRFSHFDFWENRIRDPILIDSAADILVYGMAEGAIEALVEWFQAGRDASAKFPGLPQTCIKVPTGSGKEYAGDTGFFLPSAQECRDPEKFMELAKILDRSSFSPDLTLVQTHPKGDIVCFPPAKISRRFEVFQNFNRRSHPVYDVVIPALEPVQFSVISHRGCLGTCTFCAISYHQGRLIRSRSASDITREIAGFPSHPDFHGTVPDIGGPSVNMYDWDCKVGGCGQSRLCLFPRRCPNLRGGLESLGHLLRAVKEVPGIRHSFLGSGLRYDLIGPNDWETFAEIVRYHVSGQLKVAPEHIDPEVLRLMRKAPEGDFVGFIRKFAEKCGSIEKFIVPYFMTAFPGSFGCDEKLANFIRENRLAHEQIQEFTPTPGTLATAMFFSGKDWEGKNLKVPRNANERKKGRQSIQTKRSR